MENTNPEEVQEILKSQNIEQEDISDISKKAYLDYSMSVIVNRAIPDVRDGLKPVHRRIIYSMSDLGITPKGAYKKSARITGQAIGLYHPHGDISVYDAMVAMAQDFKIREPLCDGQGNWGNIDGDSPAAMRYCVVGDTMIKTTKGLVAIKDLVKDPTIEEQDIDIEVYSLGMNINKATKFFNSGKQNIIEIVLENGFKLKGSENHPIMTIRDDFMANDYYYWKTLENLNINDRIMVNVGDDFCESRVSLINKLEEKEYVYSIRVDSDCHSFIGNGIVNHNTEVRFSEYGYSLLNNIEKKSVSFKPNYDDSTVEPEVLPAMLPNILVNGTEGIAVGMATYMTPHNANEIISATIATLKNPNITIEKLREYVKGPDLPTGGILMKDNMDSIYTNGQGRFYVKAKYHVEDDGRQIVITEIPFQVQKSNIIVEIAELVRDKMVFGIVDARDESSKEGMRIVLTIKKGENIKIIMNTLFKKTSLQKSYSVKNLVIKDKEPVVMNLKEILDTFIEFRKDIVTKDITYDINKLNSKAHLLRGISIALNNLDLTLSIVRNSKNSSESKEQLILQLNVDEIQAQAIIDTKLQKLSSLETQSLFDELLEIEKEILRLEDIISTDDKLSNFIINQLKELSKKFKSVRRTLITDEEPFISNEELITDEDVAIIITRDGFIRKTPLDNFKSQHRGGKGKSIISLRDDDYVKNVLFCKNNEYLTIFTKNNKAFLLPVYTITENLKGRLITNLIDDGSGVFDIVHTTDSKEMIFVSEKGQIVKLSGKHFTNIRKNGIKAIRLNENDKLVKVLPINDINTHLMVTTKNGITMTTELKNFRMSGRGTMGVKGMSVSKNDIIVDATVVKLDDKILLISEQGYGKQNLVSDFRITNRGSKGVKSFKISDKTGSVVGIVKSDEEKDLVVTTKKGIIIRTPLHKVSTNNGRVTVGVKIINVADDDLVISFDIYEKMENYED